MWFSGGMAKSTDIRVMWSGDLPSGATLDHTRGREDGGEAVTGHSV